MRGYGRYGWYKQWGAYGTSDENEKHRVQEITQLQNTGDSDQLINQKHPANFFSCATSAVTNICGRICQNKRNKFFSYCRESQTETIKVIVDGNKYY